MEHPINPLNFRSCHVNEKTTFAAMLKKAVSATLYLSILIVFSGCSKYSRILKSNDFEKKYDMAKLYYNNGKYQKAFPLFEELITVFRGTSKAEDVYYYYAYSNYMLGDFMLAGYHFNNFVRTFPRSDRAEDAQFMNAKCYFLDSSDPTLDQTSTRKAIDELQLFINKYPESPKVDECNDLMDRLRFKLETKAYNGAKLYYRLGEYKAAIFALRNTLADYPDTKFREEISFMKLRSSYLLADNSIEKKKEERFENTLKECEDFMEKFPRSKNLKAAENIKSDSTKELDKLKLL
ncbi:MAG: outer membrane protein assembly factor BamD [Flavobacteriales bacterium]|nr:outer membrane protein assembly factor BamD [Flavobacteriales bacterium]